MRRTAALRFKSEAELTAHRAPRLRRGQIVVPEADVLAAVLELCKRHPKVAFAHRVNSRSGYVLHHGVYKRLVASGALRHGEAQFMQFAFPGASDVGGMLRGGRVLAIECKAIDGQVTDDQQAYLDAVNGGGGLGMVARSIDEVIRALGGS